jgi:hypothetical protein
MTTDRGTFVEELGCEFEGEKFSSNDNDEYIVSSQGSTSTSQQCP